MNLSPRWVAALSEAGFEATHWTALGVNNAPDSEIMNYARSNNFVVLTHDLDFSAILAATNGNKPSVVQIRAENVSVDVLRDKVVMAINQMAPELENGALLTIDSRHARLRVLPLQSG
jgi:predicted nuclease of predicted toxin-antitoxin system